MRRGDNFFFLFLLCFYYWVWVGYGFGFGTCVRMGWMDSQYYIASVFILYLAKS